MADVLPDLSELIERAIASGRNDIHVSMPGEIVSYDPSTQTATVRPCLRRVTFTVDDEQVAEEIPPIQNVPVSFPGGNGFTIHFALAAGDTGDLIFSTYSHNEWQASGKVSTPGDLKQHGLGNAKFYPGLRNKKNAAPDTDNSIGVPGGLRAHFGASAVSIGSGGANVALDSLVLTALGTAASAAVAAAVPADGGKAAFGAFGTSIGSAIIGAGNLKADP